MKQTLKIIAASALVTAVLIKTVPGLAEPARTQNVSIVHTSDLDLTSKSGREQLDHRLVIAASEVCGTASDSDVQGKNQVRECRAAVLRDARAQERALADRSAPQQAILVAASR